MPKNITTEFLIFKIDKSNFEFKGFDLYYLLNKINMSQALPQRVKTYWMPCKYCTKNIKDCQIG